VTVRPFRDALCSPGTKPLGTPLVSVIVLNLNGASLLEGLFSSFHRHNRYRDVEILLVDHRSDDRSVDVARRWAERLPITIVKCPENYSFSFSCNRAAERAKGEFILLLNNDVELIGDIVGRMVAAVQETGGLVGIKLQRDLGSPPQLDHIGVRFRWYPNRRFLGPYNATPAAGDREIESSPSYFPAVTAAALTMRRDDYLNLGGQSEEFVYGYEDIDLCVKFRLTFDRPVICLNDISAAHWNGRTRFSRVSKLVHRDWQTRNRDIFNRRCGYPLRREAAVALYTDDGSYWGRRPLIGILATGDAAWSKLEPLAQALADRMGWSVIRLRKDWTGVDLKGFDMLIATDGTFRVGEAHRRQPNLLNIAWFIEGIAAPPLPDLSTFDLLVASDGKSALDLETVHGLPVAVVDPATGADAFLTLIRRHLADRHRFALKWATARDRALAGDIARSLRRAGHPARLDSSRHWNAPEIVRDDVAVLLPGTSACPAQLGKINLACKGWEGSGEVDEILPDTDSEKLSAAILDAVARHHLSRWRGPTDRPLHAVAREPGPIWSGWNESAEPAGDPPALRRAGA
jgi:GT2 family glycosyltransferase